MFPVLGVHSTASTVAFDQIQTRFTASLYPLFVFMVFLALDRTTSTDKFIKWILISVSLIIVIYSASLNTQHYRTLLADIKNSQEHFKFGFYNSKSFLRLKPVLNKLLSNGRLNRYDFYISAERKHERPHHSKALLFRSQLFEQNKRKIVGYYSYGLKDDLNMFLNDSTTNREIIVNYKYAEKLKDLTKKEAPDTFYVIVSKRVIRELYRTKSFLVNVCKWTSTHPYYFGSCVNSSHTVK